VTSISDCVLQRLVCTTFYILKLQFHKFIIRLFSRCILLFIALFFTNLRILDSWFSRRWKYVAVFWVVAPCSHVVG